MKQGEWESRKILTSKLLSVNELQSHFVRALVTSLRQISIFCKAAAELLAYHTDVKYKVCNKNTQDVKGFLPCKRNISKR